MVPLHAPAPQSPTANSSLRVGVGIDTSRYGHYAVFLRHDLQPAAAELAFAESAVGYQLLRQRLERIARQHPRVHFDIRLDARQLSQSEQAAGLTQTAEPAQSEVTAACADTVATDAPNGQDAVLDFAHLKRQLSMAQLFAHLGLTARLRGTGPQRRCACPIHRGDGRGRTMSVNLDANVFQCFEATCGAKGDVIDLWAALHALSLRDAALDLVQTFNLEPTPRAGTGKRKG